MSNLLINDIAFVDAIFGDDAIAQLNSLGRKFKTFDSAYMAIESLGPDRRPYKISLSSGSYIAGLSLYQNISVESTNDINEVKPEVLIPIIDQSWNGVIWSDIMIKIDVTVDGFRDPIFIVGSSFVRNNVNVVLGQFTQNSISTKQLQIDIKSLFVSEALFKFTASMAIASELRPIINFFEANNITIVGLENIDTREGIDTARNVVEAFVRELGAVLFTGVDKNEKSAIYYTIDIILSLFEKVSVSKNTIHDDNPRIPTIFKGVNRVLIGSDQADTQSSFIFSELTDTEFFNQKGVHFPKRKIKKYGLVNDNPVAQILTIEISAEYNQSVQEIINKLGDGITELPSVALINSDISSQIEGHNKPINLTNGTRQYYLDNDRNINNIILLDDEDVNSSYPIIRTIEKEGSSVTGCSKFTRYKKIDKNYTHRRLDGQIFIIDASNDDIIIEIPKNNWKGRILEYKRIDNSCNRVKIIDKTTCKKYKLKSKKSTYLRLIILETGESFMAQ